MFIRVYFHPFRNIFFTSRGGTVHSGPKIPKSEPRGDSPKFIVHLKEGHIVISKHKIFFQSVEGNFGQFSKKIWAGLPRALPPGISIKM